MNSNFKTYRLESKYVRNRQSRGIFLHTCMDFTIARIFTVCAITFFFFLKSCYNKRIKEKVGKQRFCLLFLPSVNKHEQDYRFLCYCVFLKPISNTFLLGRKKRSFENHHNHNRDKNRNKIDKTKTNWHFSGLFRKPVKKSESFR